MIRSCFEKIHLVVAGFSWFLEILEFIVFKGVVFNISSRGSHDFLGSRGFERETSAVHLWGC